MLVKPIKTRIFQEGEDLFAFVCRYFKKIPEKSVIVVTSKIVSLAEGRIINDTRKKTRMKLMRQESDLVLKTNHTWITVKDGVAMTTAGIDCSNINNKTALLPLNSFETAKILHKKLQKKYKLKELGVLITDSRSIPLHRGAMGTALGYAGFKGLRRYAGSSDLFGKKFKVEYNNIAHSLATAAVLTMGEGNECQPLAIIEDAPIEFCERINKKELYLDIEDDIYLPLFKKFSR